MIKKALQDMIPPEKRSIRRIDVSRSHARPRPRIQQEDNSLSSRRYGGTRSGKTWGIWIIAILVVVGIAGLGVSLLFSGAEITVTPRQEVVTIDGIFSARQGGEFGELSYEIMNVQQEVSREVPASGEEQVERKATGSITIYNTFDENPQRLITNTRFESSEGLVYRITESVTVPGMKGSAPGSIQATVFAETSGAEYNIPAGRFTIPGLESDAPRFKAFYAESAKGFSGGFSGVTRVVSEDDRSLVEGELENELRNALLSAAHAQTPEGFLLFDEATFVEFKTLPPTEGTTKDTARIRLQGTFFGLLFDEDTFGEYIALQTVSDYDNAPVRIHTPESVTISLPDKETLLPTALPRVDIRIQGTPRIVWQFDKNTLVQDLVGRRKDTIETLISGYPGIVSFDAVVRPFWKKAFPDDAEKIGIEVVVGEQ